MLQINRVMRAPVNPKSPGMSNQFVPANRLQSILFQGDDNKKENQPDAKAIRNCIVDVACTLVGLLSDVVGLVVFPLLLLYKGLTRFWNKK